MNRAAVDVDDLLKVILVLVIVWLALNIIEEVVQITLGVFGWLRPIIGLVLLLLIALWLLDRL
ncbi:MAG: hypothetical protein ABEJ42_01230 [Halobacteriaceae archaeon]